MEPFRTVGSLVPLAKIKTGYLMELYLAITTSHMSARGAHKRVIQPEVALGVEWEKAFSGEFIQLVLLSAERPHVFAAPVNALGDKSDVFT